MAREFDGTQLLEAAESWDTYPFAVAGWGNFDSLASPHRAIFSIYWKDASSQHFIGLRAENTTGNVNFIINGASTRKATTSGATISTDTWHHLAGIAEADTAVRAFLDAGNKDTDSGPGAARNTPDTYAIGASWFNSQAAHIDGSIAEVGLWDLSVYPGATDALKCDNWENNVLPALAAGYSPLSFPLGLRMFVPLVRDNDEDIVGGLSFTAIASPTVDVHPRVFYPNLSFSPIRLNEKIMQSKFIRSNQIPIHQLQL